MSGFKVWLSEGRSRTKNNPDTGRGSQYRLPYGTLLQRTCAVTYPIRWNAQTSPRPAATLATMIRSERRSVFLVEFDSVITRLTQGVVASPGRLKDQPVGAPPNAIEKLGDVRALGTLRATAVPQKLYGR